LCGGYQVCGELVGHDITHRSVTSLQAGVLSCLAFRSPRRWVGGRLWGNPNTTLRLCCRVYQHSRKPEGSDDRRPGREIINLGPRFGMFAMKTDCCSEATDAQRCCSCPRGFYEGVKDLNVCRVGVMTADNCRLGPASRSDNNQRSASVSKDLIDSGADS